jgi:hypothetical protein
MGCCDLELHLHDDLARGGRKETDQNDKLRLAVIGPHGPWFERGAGRGWTGPRFTGYLSGFGFGLDELARRAPS